MSKRLPKLTDFTGGGDGGENDPNDLHNLNSAAARAKRAATKPADGSSRSPHPPGSIKSASTWNGWHQLLMAAVIVCVCTCWWWSLAQWRMLFAVAAAWGVASGWRVLTDPVSLIRSLYGAYAMAHRDDIWDGHTERAANEARARTGIDSATQPPLYPSDMSDDSVPQRLRWDLPHTSFVYALVVGLSGGMIAIAGFLLPDAEWPSTPYILAVVCGIVQKAEVIVTRVRWAIKHRYWTSLARTIVVVDTGLMILIALALYQQRAIALRALLDEANHDYPATD